MRRTEIFLNTRREAPADELSRNAILLIRAGFIHKEMAGVYSYLPMGKIVLDKISEVIREEMNALGSSELLMSTLQNKDIWLKTGRWEDKLVDNWFKSNLINGQEVGIGFSHEEPLINALKNSVASYKDLPVHLYQIQTKFRNELRAKSGLLRGREFLMKDLYSFSRDLPEHENFYDKVSQAYFSIYKRLGWEDITYKTFASGGYFSEFSHEFQVLSEIGEDTIFIDEDKKIAVNSEVYSDEVLLKLGLQKDKLVKRKAVEVGNIFSLGSKYSDELGLRYTDKSGKQKSVIMGCYGIGVSRVMGLVAEHFSDDSGLMWPEIIAPAKIYLIGLGDSQEIRKKTEELYTKLTQAGISVIYDDREVRTGEMLNDADLVGLPIRVIVSEKTLKTNSCEVKMRNKNQPQTISLDKVLEIAA